MLGAIIGDIVGSRFEFNNIKTKDFELFTDDCFFTDDTVMTCAVAKAIMKTDLNDSYCKKRSNLKKNTIKYMRKLGKKYPNSGYGVSFNWWLKTNEPKPYNSFGNGAAMRISPVGQVARSGCEACDLSRWVTCVTHNHPEGLKGAEAVATVIAMIRDGHGKNSIRYHVFKNYYPITFTLDEIRKDYKFNETCQDTVPQAIVAFLESNSFEDAIRNAISIGGDSDTLAAITGSMAEAYYGIPKSIKEKALTYLDKRLLKIVDQFERRHRL